MSEMTMKHHRTHRLVATAAAVVLLSTIGACQSDEPTDNTTDTPEPTDTWQDPADFGDYQFTELCDQLDWSTAETFGEVTLDIRDEYLGDQSTSTYAEAVCWASIGDGIAAINVLIGSDQYDVDHPDNLVWGISPDCANTVTSQYPDWDEARLEFTYTDKDDHWESYACGAFFVGNLATANHITIHSLKEPDHQQWEADATTYLLDLANQARELSKR